MRNGPARERGGGGDDEEARVGAEKVGEVLHQELPELLRPQKVGGGGLAGDGQENFAGGSETVKRDVAAADFRQDGDCVCDLAEREVGKCDGDYGVSGCAVVDKGRIAEVQDWRVSAIEPGVVDTE